MMSVWSIHDIDIDCKPSMVLVNGLVPNWHQAIT